MTEEIKTPTPDVKSATPDERYLCEICGEPINREDLATYAKPDGEDDFCPEPAHQWCLDALEEQMYRGEGGDDVI
jgi:hypothetical protein